MAAAAVDRISELLEPILHHILSFLSQKEAIQTSALSKTWRHVALTGPKIELRESCFQKSGDPSFLSVLDKTLQRYYHRNLPVNEFILEMSWTSELKDQLVDRDLEKILFNGLKRLSLTRVHIKAETLEKIIRSCPLIEYLLVSSFTSTIPATIFQAEFITELYLSGYDFSGKREHLQGLNRIVTTDQLLLIKRLKTLSLDSVYIAEETLEKIMCGCPLIESLFLKDCLGLENIKINNNLKHFSGSFYQVNTKSFEIDAPIIETINIVDCPNWYGHDKYFFPRLKSLYLNRVNLSAEFFKSLSSSNFPSLEDLELQCCYGFTEILLTVSSIKRLVILIGSIKPPMDFISIYAPNIHYFKLSAQHPQRLIFNTETAAREWKSEVKVFDECPPKINLLLWLRQLSELLNSLRESQISLDVFPKPIMNLKVDQTYFCKPVPLEDVRVEGYREPSSFPGLLNCLFLICRPRYIDMNLCTINPVTDLKQEKDKLSELTTFKIKTIGNKGEMSCGYLLWVRDLEESNMQVWDENTRGWYTVGVEGTCFPGFTTSYPRIRFSFKWRD